MCRRNAFSGAQKRAEMLCHPCILGGPQRQARGTESELATSLLPSRGPKRGRKCYATPAFPGVPKQRGIKSELASSPLPSWGPKGGRNCYVTPAFSGVPKQRGTKSELAASPLPSRRPKRGWKCYVTPAFSGVPKQGDKTKSGCIGDKDKTVGMQPKRISPKNFAQMVRFHQKTSLNPPPPDHFKKGGGFQNPSWYRISENPPPLHTGAGGPCIISASVTDPPTLFVAKLQLLMQLQCCRGTPHLSISHAAAFLCAVVLGCCVPSIPWPCD